MSFAGALGNLDEYWSDLGASVEFLFTNSYRVKNKGPYSQTFQGIHIHPHLL